MVRRSCKNGLPLVRCSLTTTDIGFVRGYSQNRLERFFVALKLLDNVDFSVATLDRLCCGLRAGAMWKRDATEPLRQSQYAYAQ